MTPNVVEKYSGEPFITTLEILRELMCECENDGAPNSILKSRAIYYRIAGYTQALSDCRAVTKKESEDLFVYYALTPSYEKQQKIKKHFQDLFKSQEKGQS